MFEIYSFIQPKSLFSIQFKAQPERNINLTKQTKITAKLKIFMEIFLRHFKTDEIHFRIMFHLFKKR